MENKLKGWNYIVYMIIKNNFSDVFDLKDIYKYKKDFSSLYPENFHIEEKIRQTLQNLRDKSLIEFIGSGKYKINEIIKLERRLNDFNDEIVYMLSNESIPNWIKIGRTNNIERRLKELYNTSVPTQFNLENSITTAKESSRVLEKCIHELIDTINPDSRKNTSASRREFFKLTLDQANKIFEVATKMINIKVDHL